MRSNNYININVEINVYNDNDIINWYCIIMLIVQWTWICNALIIKLNCIIKLYFFRS